MSTTSLRAIAIALLLSAPITARAAGPTKAGVSVTVSHAALHADSNFVHIIGEVRNDTPDTIHSVRFDVTLLDAKGSRLRVASIVTATREDMGEADADDFVMTEREFVPPGEVAVFHYLRDASKIGGAYGSYKLGKPRYETSSKAPKAVLEGFVATKNADGGFDIAGTIKSAGKTGCRSPRAVLGMYDASGKLVEIGYKEPDETFQKDVAPGKSIAFRYTVHNIDGDIASVKAWGDCRVPNY